MDIENTNENDESKAVMLFGRDIRKIPCFKQSMINGIYAGVAAGLATFLFTSRPKLATNVGVGSYMGVVLVYFSYCRYNHAKQKYALRDLQYILQMSDGNLEKINEDSNKDLQEQQKKLIDA